ncbi:hypothetical protein KSB_15240 [Ktedonobacter robiniae]|uniref:Uncharacterized protein n=1 Tax=Ktedonobacter robiniae TaxID=2778365 RepID=A0ABQ3UK24_9CHLR|nr:hypothetical protein KSB_15240 [Ktedonobacter robiniae]
MHEKPDREAKKVGIISKDQGFLVVKAAIISTSNALYDDTKRLAG